MGLEQSANAKRDLGYDMPRNPDGSINFDQAVQQKTQQTEVMVRAYNQYMGHDEPQAQKLQKWEFALAGGRPHLAMSPFAALSLAALFVIGGAAFLTRRLPRRNAVALPAYECPLSSASK